MCFDITRSPFLPQLLLAFIYFFIAYATLFTYQIHGRTGLPLFAAVFPAYKIPGMELILNKYLQNKKKLMKATSGCRASSWWTQYLDPRL